MHQYVWGLDLSGQNGNPTVAGLHAAGGIGGLLAMRDTRGNANPQDDRSYLYLYEAHGNAGQLVSWDEIADWQSLSLTSANDWHASRLAAHYEYDPYGGTALATGNVQPGGALAARLSRPTFAAGCVAGRPF